MYIEFTPNTLLRLLTHYFDGEVPLDSELHEFGVHPILSRKVMIAVRTKEATSPEIQELRYEGGKTLSWKAGQGDPIWNEAPEGPK